VVTLARDLDVFASRIPAGFAAIFLARRNFTNAWDVRALGFALIFHLGASPRQFVVLLDQMVSSCEPFSAFGSPHIPPR
jgi:hypothetical protein